MFNEILTAYIFYHTRKILQTRKLEKKRASYKYGNNIHKQRIGPSSSEIDHRQHHYIMGVN